VVGEEVDAGRIGKRPVGQVARNTILAVDYQLPWAPNLSLTAFTQSISRRMASSDNQLTIPARAVLDLGARYRFRIGPAPATLRIVVANVFDTFGWRTNASGVFVTNAPRRLAVTLTADF
jgi:iron complex outermembrane receptor protein